MNMPDAILVQGDPHSYATGLNPNGRQVEITNTKTGKKQLFPSMHSASMLISGTTNFISNKLRNNVSPFKHGCYIINVI